MPRASRLLLAGMLACASRADPVWLSPAETIELGCYAMRHPDLLLGFCKGELELHKTPDLKHEIRSCDYHRAFFNTGERSAARMGLPGRAWMTM